MLPLVNTQKAIKIIARGGVLILPTETSYGICADATNQKAAERIYKIKGRPLTKTMPLVVSCWQLADKVCFIDGVLRKIAQKYWPGPLTVVAPHKKEFVLADGTYDPNSNEVALRISSNLIMQKISSKLQVPLVATSANLSGEDSNYSIKELLEKIDSWSQKPDGYIDGGILTKNQPSTIIALRNNELVVLRQGLIGLA